ncbi:uncharacterized protein A4U43_C03F21430 [Asparagus officinalis]|uniref:Uncharacterized protein n=1 Tax=Asparagus officinalis TaxID=4686 RepID=A0A5P1FCQ1_ASPOF|nr:uncharacterized protein A4U43_C03F21430 [Asparagus officinalis]
MVAVVEAPCKAVVAVGNWEKAATRRLVMVEEMSSDSYFGGGGAMNSVAVVVNMTDDREGGEKCNNGATKMRHKSAPILIPNGFQRHKSAPILIPNPSISFLLLHLFLSSLLRSSCLSDASQTFNLFKSFLDSQCGEL